MPFWCRPTGFLFCARSLVPSESHLVCDARLHWRRVGSPGRSALLGMPHGFLLRAHQFAFSPVSFCVDMFRSACFGLSKESLDFAVLFTMMPAAGLLCCALSSVPLFSRSQPSLCGCTNSSGNSVFGIEHFNLRFLEFVADAGKLHQHVFELLEPAALLPLPCILIHNLYKSEHETIAHAYCVVFVSCAE